MDKHMIKARIYAVLTLWLALTGLTIGAILLGTATGLSKTDPQPPWQFSQLWQAIMAGPFVYLLGVLGASLLITVITIIMDKPRRDFILFGKRNPFKIPGGES